MHVAEYLVHFSNILMLVAYSVRDILWLRWFAVAAALTNIPYFLVRPERLWPPVVWALVFATINLFQILRIYMERRPVTLSDDEQKLYDIGFRSLRPREFVSLMLAGEWKNAAVGDRVLTEGTPVSSICIAISGTVHVQKRGEDVLDLEPGQIIGTALARRRVASRPSRRTPAILGPMTHRAHVFVSRRIPDDGLDLIREACDLELWDDELPPSRTELLRAVAGCEGILTLLTDRVDDELLDAAGPQLRVVSDLAVGYDNVDVPACTRRRIAVGNTPGVLTETTADLAFALLMAGARRIAEGDRLVRAGGWRTWGPLSFLGTDVHGSTLGIVGFGRIGQAVARRATGFGMPLLYAGRHRAAPEEEAAAGGASFVPLDELLARSDFVSVHVPLGPATRRLIGAAELRRMKPTAILINTSRGPVVDQAALYEALRDGIIGGAALDVTDPEPMPGGDPLLTLDNCLVVPHIASASRATRGRMAAMAAANLIAGVRGERLPNPVNPEIYET